MTNKSQFFEGIENLVEKNGELFYKGKYYGRIDQDRSSHLTKYKGVLEVKLEILSLRKQLEKRNYLVTSIKGPCPIS